MKKFKFQKADKLLLSLAVIVLLAAGCNQSKQLPIIQPLGSVNQPVSRQAGAPASANAVKPSGQIPVKQNSGGTASSTANQNKPDYVPGQEEPPSLVGVAQIVDGKPDTAQVTLYKGMNAMAFLKLTHKVVSKDYGAGMGEFVQSIDGVAPDSKHFWEFYVNGKSSNIGASSYKMQDGDKIEWKLTLISSSGQ